VWLFGGANSFGSNGTPYYYNDLWEFSPATQEWTWMGGSNTPNQAGVYGKLGAFAPANLPGGRWEATHWTDSAGNLWVFGGYGYDSAGQLGYLNDLWELSPAMNEWAWMGGSETIPGVNGGQPGTYGAPGTPAAANTPGSRSESVGWSDNSGNLWLFGGNGFDSAGTQGYLNDLWEFNPFTAQWAWIAGSSTVPCSNCGQAGVYGMIGSPAATNLPGGRQEAVGWRDRSGNLWLFGGQGYGISASTYGYLTDLWEFSPVTGDWTWVSGGSSLNDPAMYGTLGVASQGNTPGARVSAVSWADNGGNFWLFGGDDYSSNSKVIFATLSDLWEYQPSAISTQAPATVSLGSLSQTYTGSPLSATATTTPAGLAVTFTYNGSANAPTAAGSYTVVGTINDLNYQGSATGTLVIGQATATITVTPYSVTYDANAHTATGTTTGIGGVNLIADLNLTGTTHTNAGAYPSDAWSFTDPAGNYTSANGTVSDAIGQVTASITVTPYSVTYDSNAHTAIATATGVGGANLIADLNVTGTTHTNAGSYASDAWSFTDPAGNYASANGTVSDAIGQAAANISVIPYNVTYDGNAHTATGTATGVGGVNLAADFNLTGTTHTNAGAYPSDRWTFTDPAGNYANANGTVSDTISQATLHFSPAGGTYVPAQTVTISGAPTGAAIYYTTDGTTPTANSSVYGGPIALPSPEKLEAVAIVSGNAVTAVASASYTILEPLIAATSPNSAVAGGPGFTITVTGSNFFNTAVVEWSAGGNTIALPTTYVSANQLNAQVPAAYIATAGSAVVLVMNLIPGQSIFSNTLPFTITVPPVLTVTANNASRIVGAANPALSVTYSGFVNGDTAATALTGSPAISTTATASSPAGNYPIVVSSGTLASAKYTFNFVNGTLSVLSAPTVALTASATLKATIIPYGTLAEFAYEMTVTITNTGTSPATNVQLTNATLGSLGLAVFLPPVKQLPRSVGTIAPNGGSATVLVWFARNPGSDGTTVAEKIAGTSSGGSFSTSLRSVTLP
jgi:hypothetical protein